MNNPLERGVGEEWRSQPLQSGLQEKRGTLSHLVYTLLPLLGQPDLVLRFLQFIVKLGLLCRRPEDEGWRKRSPKEKRV